MMSRDEAQKMTVARVVALLGAAGIRVTDFDVAPGEVSAEVKSVSSYETNLQGRIRVSRRTSIYEADLWSAQMGDPECIAMIDLIDPVLRGLGYRVERIASVPNMLTFFAPDAIASGAVDCTAAE